MEETKASGVGAGAGAGVAGAAVAAAAVDLPVSTAEFQVVLLTGDNPQLMYPLSENTCRSVMPVALRPLIAYQLDLLEKSGFSEVIVVLEKRNATSVQNYCATRNGRLKVIPVVVDNDTESADCLRAAAARISKDFMVIAGDLITEASLHDLADIYRIQDSSLTMLLKEKNVGEVDARGRKKKLVIDDYIGVADAGRVVMMAAEQDVEGIVDVHKRLLKRVPSISLRADLLDCHLYILSHWVLDLIQATPAMTSIKADVVPWLIRHQFRSIESLGHDGDCIPQNPAESPLDEKQKQPEPIRCFCSIIPAKGQYCARINSVASFATACTELATRPVSMYTPWPKPPAPMRKYRDSVAGDSVEVGSKVTMKKCVIGNNCSIGSSCKLASVILFDNVAIGTSCILQNSVIAQGAKIGDGCQIIDCHIGPGQVVESGARLKDEQVGNSAAFDGEALLF